MNFACQQHQKPLKVCYHSSLNEERPRKTKRSQRLRKRAFVCFSNMHRLDPDSARKSMWLLPVHCDPSRWYNQPVETRLFTRRKQYNNYYLNSKVSIITRPKKVLKDRSNFDDFGTRKCDTFPKSLKICLEKYGELNVLWSRMCEDLKIWNFEIVIIR